MKQCESKRGETEFKARNCDDCNADRDRHLVIDVLPWFSPAKAATVDSTSGRDRVKRLFS